MNQIKLNDFDLLVSKFKDKSGLITATVISKKGIARSETPQYRRDLLQMAVEQGYASSNGKHPNHNKYGIYFNDKNRVKVIVKKTFDPSVLNPENFIDLPPHSLKNGLNIKEIESWNAHQKYWLSIYQLLCGFQIEGKINIELLPAWYYPDLKGEISLSARRLIVIYKILKLGWSEIEKHFPLGKCGYNVMFQKILQSKSAEIIECDADDRDMRTLAQYLPGFDRTGKWIKAKCPAHDGESSDSLHIDPETGGFICHAGCSSSSVYSAAKAVAVGAGHRFEVVSIDAELSQNLKESLNLKNGKAPNLFGGKLGNLLSIAAGNFNIPVEILNFCLLPILGSQIKSETDLLINPGTDYKVRAIRWCGLVGETGTKKSPIIDILTGAMSSIQREVADRYKAEKLEYDAAFRAWKASKPADRGDEPAPVTPMMDLYFSDFTIESISQSISNHPDSGYLVYNDELAGFFKSMDAYRKNGGGDRQKWLTLYNGGALKVNRKSSDTIFIPQTSVSIVGGIQPSTIEHLISGDESQEDGLWNRFMFTRLPQTRIDAFSHTPYSLTEHLETLYRSLASQQSFRHFLSEESKPLWADWHVWTEDKTFSESSWIARGTYAKIEGIAARNALIIHRTMAAIAGVIPDRQISASTMAIAIDWTKWELSQTLLEYQMLGLTNDPEQSRILKFLDKFSGKGWVIARDVDRWWSARTKPPANELREFMAKVVKLGQAIDNDEAIESSKYRIQISSNGSDSSDKNSVNVAEKQTRLSLPLVTNLSPEAVKHSHNGDSEFVTTTRSIGSDKSENRQDIQTEINADEFVTNFATNGSDKPETSLNGHHSQQSTNFVTKGSDSVNSIYDKQFSDSVTTVTTDSNKNIFKIGDYAKAGDDIVVITEVEEDYISGLDKDKNRIGGNPDSFTMSSPEEFAATQGELDDEWN